MYNLPREIIKRVRKIRCPHQVTWNLLYRCNLNCIFCALSQVRRNINYNKLNELNLAEVNRILKELEKAGIGEIYFTGGEPLIRSDFFDILDKTKELGLDVEFVTNGTLFSKEVINKIVHSGVRSVMVSINGTNDWVDRKIYGKPGVSNVVLKNIKKLVEIRNEVGAKIRITTNTVLTTENIFNLKELAQKLSEIGIDKANLQPFFKFNDQVDFLTNFDTADSREESLFFLNSAPNDEKLSDEEYNQQIKNFISGGRRKCDHCFNPVVSTYISYDGNVSPCCFLSEREEYLMGNLKKDSFEKIWFDKKFKKWRYNNLESLQADPCRTCVTLLDKTCKKFLMKEGVFSGIS